MKIVTLLTAAVFVAVLPGLAQAANPFAPKPKTPTAPVTTSPQAPVGGATVLEQIDSANKMMQLPISDAAFLQQYPVRLADGLSGTYMAATTFDKTTENAANLQMFCGQKVVKIDATDPMRITYTWFPGQTNEYTVYLTALGGMRYAASGDVAAIAKFTKMDPNDPATEASTLQWLTEFTGTAILLRPSPDILILQIGTHRPTMLAKCS